MDHSYPSSLTADFPPAEVVPSDSPEMMYSISILESMVLSSSELVVLKKRMLLFDNFTNVVSLAPITRNNFLVLWAFIFNDFIPILQLSPAKMAPNERFP